MGTFLVSPTFVPHVPPIPLGTNGQVLTMVGGIPSFAAGAPQAATLGGRIAFASPAGVAVAAAPAGFGPSTGRILVTLPLGNATWVSLTAGVDGQLLVVRNADATNLLILPAADWGGTGDLGIAPGGRVLIYYDATDALWERTS